MALALTLVLTIAWRVQARRRGEDPLAPFRRRTPLHGPIGLFVLLSVLSCLFSTHVLRSLQEVKGFGTFLLVPFTAALVEDGEDADFLLDVWRLTSVYMVLMGLAEALGGAGGTVERLTGGMSVYMTYAGLLMAFVLLLGARGLTGGGRSRADRAFDLLVAGCGVVAVLMTLTRNAYLGLAAGALVLALAARPRAVLAVPLLAAALYLAGPAEMRQRVQTAFDSKDDSLLDRLAMWRSGLAMVEDRPFFGVGPGRIKETYPVYRLPGHVETYVGHLHNNVVMVAAETGIASALAYLAFVASSLVRSWPLARGAGPARAAARGALAAMVALFLAGLFEYNFGDVEVLMATLVLATLPFAARGAAPHEPVPAAPGPGPGA